MKAVRILAGLLAVLLIIAGAAVALALGPDDTWGGTPQPVPEARAVVTTDPGLLNVAGLDLTVTAHGEGEVFIGASHPVHVEDYLRDVHHTRVTALDADGISATEDVEGEKPYPTTTPEELAVWTEQAAGSGGQQIAVPLTEDAPVQIVATPMTADEGAPEVGIGYTLTGAFVTGVVVVLIGLVLLVAVTVLGRRSRRARTGRAGTSNRPAGEGERDPERATPPSSGATVRSVVAVGAVTLVASACTVPHQVDHGESSGVVPLASDEAQAALDDYDERNNAAIKRSHEGDGSLWGDADTGALLAVDVLEARINDVDAPTGEPGVHTHTVEETYPAALGSYPLWAVVETTDARAGEKGDEPSIDVLVKEHVASPWKGSATISLKASDVPTPLPVDRATPGAADLKRAAEVDSLLQTWVEKGTVSGLMIPKDLKKVRTEVVETGKGVDRVQVSADAWARADDVTGPAGPVRALRVEEGLLVITSQQWEARSYLKSGFEWQQDEEAAKIYGAQHQDNHLVRNLALQAAVLVPDSGDARVLGSWASRVVDFPRG